jgi:MFS family permease
MTMSGSLAPLRHAPFRWLVAGRTISMLGNAVAPIALAFAVLDLTGSVRDIGLVVGAKSAASVVFLLVGGVIADRFPRRLVMVAASGLAAVTQGLAAAAVFTGTATIPLLAAWCDRGDVDADGRQRLLEALVAIPTDRAFGLLIERLTRRGGPVAVRAALRRDPARGAARGARGAGVPPAAPGHPVRPGELAGYRQQVLDAAAGYGGPALAGVEALLDVGLDLLPKRIPPAPAWLDPAVLPPVLLRGRDAALPTEAVRHLCTMLAISEPDRPYAGVGLVPTPATQRRWPSSAGR